MWKRLLAVVLCICLLSVFLFGCGGSTVYKYNSLTISMPDDADSDAGGFGVLGQQLANTLLESLLKDSYIEKKADGSYSFFTTISGQSDVDIDSMLSDEETTFEIDGDLLIISADGFILTYKKATSDEIKVYKRLVEQKSKTSEDSDPDSEARTEEAAEAEATTPEPTPEPAPEPTPEPTPEPETIQLGDYYAVEVTQNGETSDFTDAFLCLENESDGFIYTNGAFTSFHWQWDGSEFSFTDETGTVFSGTYKDGVIHGTASGSEFTFDSNYSAPQLPIGKWHALSWTDENDVTVDMPYQGRDFMVETESGNTGSITINFDTVRRYEMEWEQRGKSILGTDEDGDYFIALYYEGLLYFDYLGNSFVLENDNSIEIPAPTSTDIGFNKEDYNTGITYEQIERQPDAFYGSNLFFSGTVSQIVSETSEEVNLILDVDDNSDKILVVGFDPSTPEYRVMEGDRITVYGVAVGLNEVEYTNGTKSSFPGVWADAIDFIAFHR